VSEPYYTDPQLTLWHGDSLAVLRELPDASVDCCVTSPPYFGLRDYGEAGQYGLEASPAEYVETMRALFCEVRRVLADDGTLWLNLGDSYSGGGGGAGGKAGAYIEGGTPQRNGAVHYARIGIGPKNLLGIPWRTAFALQGDGWILRNDIIWAKPNAMPESVTDRLSTRHEHLFMFSKARTYWFDLDPIREPLQWPDRITGHMFGGANKAASLQTGSASTRTGSTYDSAPEGGRNPGDVWTIATQPFTEAHFAVMPLTLAERAVQAGCRPGGTVLDPFSGSGTTGLAAAKHGRKYVGIDLNAGYLDLSLRTRLQQPGLDFGEPA
jgi:DNA modification methylase